MNKVIMLGRLTKDLELRTLTDDRVLVKGSIAVDRKHKREGEAEADFFNITAFGKTAVNMSKYLHKGSKIAIDGELRNNNYTDKDGHKVYSNEIIVNSFDFAETKSTNNSGDSTAHPAPDEGFMSIPDNINDDIPFGN